MDEDKSKEAASKETARSKETVSKETVEISPRTGKPIDKRHSPKTKRKRNTKSPVIGDNGLMLDDGDNSKFLAVNIKLFNMPDVDMEDADAVAERLTEYFKLYAEADMKPTVAGMAMALGMNRQTLSAIAHDAPTGSTGYKSALPKPVTDLIKKAYFLLENMWETYMNSGKINPVSGIFLGKNNYGYQDKTEHILTPNQKDYSDYNADEIRERYKRLSDGDSD